jgi:hypothetical protein
VVKNSDCGSAGEQASERAVVASDAVTDVDDVCNNEVARQCQRYAEMTSKTQRTQVSTACSDGSSCVTFELMNLHLGSQNR